ncbi:HesA/MoeB/ThiF family protein [Roseicyclus sp.]|uniref:HesA/MoeB/ThiF family protein n=1 Tax=Roseicyclus sp. TaxID=1914329 RepID=UPI003F6C7774
MVFVLALGAMLWGLGHLMKTPYRARFVMLALLYLAVVAVQIVLPITHPLRQATGGSLGEWLFVGILVGVVLVYRGGLGWLRARADRSVQAAPVAAPKGPFSDEELERYARHITLREIGGSGQRALKAARVLVVGAGGLGAPALLYLAAAGVGRVGVIDADTVSLSNLQRQVIHTDARQGMPKVFSAQKAMADLNPHVEVRPYNRALEEGIAAELFAEYDLILDGTDSFAARAMINRAAVRAGKPVVAGAISAWEGQVTVYDPARGAPCMACIFPQAPAPGLSATCAETGVVGALPGVIGAMMAMEAVKLITGAGVPLAGRMVIHDALMAESREIKLARRGDCPVCGGV